MNTYEKLDPEFKAKWVAALRSGEYKQGQNNGKISPNYLYDSLRSCYCCLGVAGVVAGVPVGKMDRATYFGSYCPEYQIEAPDGFPVMLQVTGESHTAGVNVALILAEMNDEGKSFNEIADWIEENL